MLSTASSFHIPSQGPYLLSHSAGPLLKCAAKEFEAHFFSPWAHLGGEAWGAWLGQIDRFCQALADLLDTTPDLICPKPNLSSGLYSLLSAIPIESKRRTLLASEHMFPTLGFVATQAKALGFTLKLIPKTQNPADLSVWLEAMTEDVCAVIVMHVHSNTGVLSPVASICELARQNNIFSVVDIAQSVGIIPISLQNFKADFVIGSSLKWLCAGPGAGFLWISQDRLIDCFPQDSGWFSHENPFEMDIHHFKAAGNAKRFLGGTPSVAPFCLAAHAIETHLSLGIDNIFRHNRALIAHLLALVPEVFDGLDLNRNGATLCLALGDKTDKAAQALKERQCAFDQRHSTLRLSFHHFNDLKDADIVAEALKSV